MTDKEYTTGGEYPGPLHLTTCTGCGEPRRYYGARKGTHCQNCGKPWAEADATSAVNVTTSPSMRTPPRIAPDEVRELLTDCRRAVYAYWVLIDIEHPVNEVLTKLLSRLDAALAAASGDDGGTP